MIDQMSAFDPKQVCFIGVNQAEPKDRLKTFLETRRWKFEVAFDANQRVGQSSGVEGIPHAVVIGPDGKAAFVKTGYEPDGAEKIAETVRKLLWESFTVRSCSFRKTIGIIPKTLIYSDKCDIGGSIPESSSVSGVSHSPIAEPSRLSGGSGDPIAESSGLLAVS